MENSDFTADAPGELVKNMNGNWAFVPAPLPGKFQWSDRLVSVISEAESALGRLAGLGQKFPRPHRLRRLFLRREAELSSRIENTYAGVRTQLLFKFVSIPGGNSSEVKEVDNNFRALEKGVQAVRRRPFSMGLVRQLHATLFTGLSAENESGKYREVQAHIGRTPDIAEARFVPAPPHKIQDCLEQLERFILEDQTTPRLARLAMIHYQFEAIHPFSDGNGRIGRAIVLLLILKMGLLPLPLFNPSAHLESSRRQYYDHLLAVSQRGAWADWIEFFCAGIVTECSDVNGRLEKLGQLRRRYQEAVQSSRTTVKITKVVDELFAQPTVDVDSLRKTLNVWPASAQRLIDRLVSLKILREVTGSPRNRVYIADEIVKVFDIDSAK